MTPKEQSAFVDSYATNLAYVSREEVADFVARYESGEDVPYCGDHISIMDALGVWHDAMKFSITKEATA